MAVPELIRSFLDRLNHAVLVRDSRKTVIYLNPAAVGLTGWRLEQIEGRRCREVFGLNAPGCPMGCDAADGAGASAAFECDFQTRSGTPRRVRAVASPIDLGTETGTALLFEAVLQDQDRAGSSSRRIDPEALAAAVAGQRWAEAALTAQEEFVHSIFDTIQEGISILDPDLTIRRVNRIMEQWYAGRGAIVGRRCYECYHERIGPCHPCPSLRCIQTGQVEREVVPGPKGSPVQWIELFSFPVKAPGSGKVRQVVEFVRDITERVRMEMQIQHLQRLEAFSILVKGLSHQLEAALATANEILTQPDLCDKPPKDPAGQPEDLAQSLQPIARILEQLKAYLAGERYDVAAVAPSNLVQQTLERITPLLAGQIRIETDLAADLPTVMADATQIQLALSNLIRNGAEALGASGRIRLTGRRFCGTPPADGAPAGIYLRLGIEDEGCGMTQETRRRLFDPFFSTKGYGRGLGGAAAAWIVAAHGGWIEVESKTGHGTRVAVYLPATQKASPAFIAL